MEVGQMITGCIVSLIAVLSAIYVSFTARCKGPIFSNTYLWYSKREREKADKRAEYRLVTIIFGCLSVIFALLAVYIFTAWTPAFIFMYIMIACVVVFSIAQAKKEKNR